jgi:copper(I)-binding protein
MNLTVNKTCRFLKNALILPVLALATQTSIQAEPLMIPGFLGIESSYIEKTGEDTANAYFTFTNLHYGPVLLLSASSDIFANTTLNGANNEELEYIEVLPRERVVMEPGGLHMQLHDLDPAITSGETVEVTLLVRQGREPEEEVEEHYDNSLRKLIKGGIPNEKEFVMHISVRE